MLVQNGTSMLISTQGGEAAIRQLPSQDGTNRASLHSPSSTGLFDGSARMQT